MEAQRPLLDRLIGSLELPRHDILFGRTFTETVVSLARSWFPETYASVIDDAHVQFGTQHLSIAGLHRHYLAHPEELPTQVRAFFSAAQGNLPAVALDWSLARPRVLPLLVSNRLLEHDVTSVAPSHTGEDVILEEWVNGLSIAFTLEQSARRAAPAGETPARERMITREDLAHWNVTAEELRAQALQNLVHHSREHVMEGRKSDGFTMLCLSNSDRHNATRILLPELHLKLRDHLGPTFLAAIPSREVLIAFNISDEDVLFRMRQDVAHDFRHSSRPLSPKLFLVTPDGIAGDPEEAEDFHI
jgi:hypothetical protein